MPRECKITGIPTKEEAERVAQSMRDDGCTEVSISGDGPYTVTGSC